MANIITCESFINIYDKNVIWTKLYTNTIIEHIIKVTEILYVVLYTTSDHVNLIQLLLVNSKIAITDRISAGGLVA